MSRYFSSLISFLLTLFSWTSLQANETSLQLLGPREGHPSSIVDGVSTITGDYSELEVDLVVPGPDTLNLSRFYSSGDHSSSNNFGGWRLLSKCLLSVQKDPKGNTYSTSEGKFDRTYVRVGTNEGSILTYVGWQNTSNSKSRSLYKVDAQQLIHLIDKDKIGIFGRDVYKLTATLESLSDNWSCESTESESADGFNPRNKQESLKYIKNYPVEKGEKILFSIIFTEQIC